MLLKNFRGMINDKKSVVNLRIFCFLFQIMAKIFLRARIISRKMRGYSLFYFCGRAGLFIGFMLYCVLVYNIIIYDFFVKYL